MKRENLNDLFAFLAVAQAQSFTRAAAKLGVSQSTLSHTVRALEARLGVRLLTRTTRSVSPTEAGEQLLQAVAPRLEEIEAELLAVREFSDKPAGTIRITAIDSVADAVLWPRLAPLLKRYPDLNIEISTDYRLVDIVAERFDIGVRGGDQVEKDMVAVRISDDIRMVIAAAPDYLAAHGTPQTVEDLHAHNCISLRLTSGARYAWELERNGRVLPMRIDGQTSFNSVYQMLNAALSGNGLAFLPEYLTRPHHDAGRLHYLLADNCPTWPPLHAYYPSRRESSRALKLVVDALRYVPSDG